MTTRRLLDQFQLPNIGYAGCDVTVYVADANGLPTVTKATLYDSLTGAGTLFNPQTFTSEGALSQPTYIGVPVVPVVTGAHVASQTLGVVCPPGGWRGDYVAGGTLYLPGDELRDGAAGTNTKDVYAVVNLFLSTTWAADVANTAKLGLAIDYVALAATVVPFATRAQINSGTASKAIPPDQFATSKFDPTGKHVIPIDAASMVPSVTNGAAVVTSEDATNKHNRRGLSFSNATQQFGCFDLSWPKSADESTITFQFEWDYASSSGNVEFAVEAVGTGDGDTEDVAYGTAVSVIDTGLGTGKRHISPASAALTIASLAEGDTVQFRVKRIITTSGNLAAAVVLRKLRTFITTNTGNDA